MKGFLTPSIDDNIVIREDNEGAIKMATIRFSSRHTRHVDLKHYIVRDPVEGGVVQINHVKTEEQHADVLMKALGVNTFETQARVLLNARATSTTVYDYKRSDVSTRQGLIKIVQPEPLTGIREAHFCQTGQGVREAIISSTLPER